ncbi:hypothetical protein Tco_0928960, partial [Tanacetum coccineum]
MVYDLTCVVNVHTDWKFVAGVRLGFYSRRFLVAGWFACYCKDCIATIGLRTGFVKDYEKGVNGDANEYGHEELESSSNGLKNSAVNKDGVANVNVTFSTDVDSVMAGRDNLHDVNVGQTPSNSTANPNK